jgi:hypothetical protein
LNGMSADSAELRLCRLEQAVGVEAACPEGRCPFWEPGGAVLEGRCAFEAVSLGDDRDVARWLIDVRGRLETSKAGR